MNNDTSIARSATRLLGVIWWGLAVTLALAVVLLVLILGSGRRGTLELGVPAAFDLTPPSPGVTAPALGIAGGRIEHARGTLRVPLHDRRFAINYAAGLIAMLMLALFVVAQLHDVFATVRRGTPFVAENVRRLRRIGGSVIAGAVVWAVFTLLSDWQVASQFSAAGLRFSVRPDINVTAFVCGVLILAIAEVFRAGTRLDEDQSLTI